MDDKVAEDMAPVHWSLDKEQTSSFLANLFPDKRLFLMSNVAPDTAGAQSVKLLLIIMEEVLQQENGCWKYYPDPSKSENWEEEIATFLNDIICHTPNTHMCTR